MEFGIYDINVSNGLNYKERLDIYKKSGFKSVGLYIDENGYICSSLYIDGSYRVIRTKYVVELNKVYAMTVTYNNNTFSMYINGLKESLNAENYKKFLSSGCSDYPLNILKKCNINIVSITITNILIIFLLRYFHFDFYFINLFHC